MAGFSSPGSEVTDVAAKVNPQTSNPLDTMTKLQGLQQGALQNRLLGQQVEGKISMGKAAQASVNPDTGEFDGKLFLKKLAEDPKGAFQVPEAAAQAVARNLQQMQLDSATLDLTGKRWSKVSDVAGMLLSRQTGPDGKPAPLTRDAVIKGLSDGLIGSGMFNDPQALTQIASVVRTLPTDESGLRDRLAQIYLQGHLTSEGVALLKGTPTPVDTGGSTQVIQASPLTGNVQSMAEIPKTLSPAQKVAPAYQRWNPVTKQMENVLTGDAVAAMDGTGGNTAAPPGVPTGPALGQATGADAAASKAVEQLSELRQQAEKVPDNKGALLNIRDTVKHFTPGAKTNWLYALKSFATFAGVATPQVKDEAAAQEEFNKLTTQFINNQVGALGGTGTDAKLESARHGSPHEFMTRQGIENVTALMLGLNDALAAKNLAAQKWLDAGNGPETYPKFVAQFNQVYNPRVFQSMYMSEDQKKAMIGNMTPTERQQFQRDWIFAKKAGWIQ